MDDIKALHTAARRYCMDRAEFWHRRYAEMNADSSSESEQATYPRYNVLEAVLEEVERFVPDDFRTLAEARETLVLAGETVNNLFTEPPNSTIGFGVMQEERQKFCHYISTISECDLHTIESLPYRRTLSRDEEHTIWTRLQERWGSTDFDKLKWGIIKIPEILVFHAAAVYHELGDAAIGSVLVDHGIKRLWEIREFGRSSEIDTVMTEFQYGVGGEAYWTSGDMDWFIFASHESSVTFAGEWLLFALKRAWPNGERSIISTWG